MPIFAKLPLRFPEEAVIGMHPIVAWACVVCAVLSACVLIWFLVHRPALDGRVKFALFLGFGVFPIGSAMSGNIAGFEHTKERRFCGSCHVMTPYRRDVENLASHSLASAHARNEEFGPYACYECHQDYGAFSTVMTKLGGLRHVYEYYTHYYKVDVKSALAEIELYKPFSNAACMRCHSTETTSWLKIGDHGSALDSVRSGHVSCVSDGCHGPAHPFSKPKAHARQVAR